MFNFHAVLLWNTLVNLSLYGTGDVFKDCCVQGQDQGDRSQRQGQGVGTKTRAKDSDVKVKAKATAVYPRGRGQALEDTTLYGTHSTQSNCHQEAQIAHSICASSVSVLE